MPNSKTRFLFLLPLLFLVACSPQSGVDSSAGGSSIEPAKEELTLHAVEYGGDTPSCSKEEFFAFGWESFHKNKHYKNVKITITSDQPFAEKDEEHSYVYGLDEVTYVANVNEERYANIFTGVAGLNVINPDPSILMQCEVFRAFSSFLYYGSRLANQEDDFEAYSTYKVTTTSLTMLFDVDFYLASATVALEGKNFDFAFGYFNKEDVPTANKETDEETFLLTLYALSNHEIGRRKVHLTYDGIFSHAKYDEEEGYWTAEVLPLHYEAFLLFGKFPFDLMRTYTDMNTLAITHYQAAVIEPEYDAEITDGIKQWMKSVYENSSGILFNGATAFRMCQTRVGATYNGYEKAEYRLGELTATGFNGGVANRMRFDQDGYLTYYSRANAIDGVYVPGTEDFVLRLDYPA